MELSSQAVELSLSTRPLKSPKRRCILCRRNIRFRVERPVAPLIRVQPLEIHSRIVSYERFVGFDLRELACPDMNPR
jgi:hypothetical protein